MFFFEWEQAGPVLRSFVDHWSSSLLVVVPLMFLLDASLLFPITHCCIFIVSRFALFAWSDLSFVYPNSKLSLFYILYWLCTSEKKTSFVSARCPPCKGQLEEGDNREGGEVGQHSLHPDHCVHLQLKLVALQRENILFSSQKKCYHSITVLLWHYDILWYDGIKVQWYHKGIMLLPGEDSLCGSWEWRQQAEGKAGSEKSI